MNYIKPSDVDAAPQMPEWAVALQTGKTDLFKNKYNKKYGNSASTSPDTSQCRLAAQIL